MAKLLEIFKGGTDYPYQYNFTSQTPGGDPVEGVVNTRVPGEVRASSHLKPGSRIDHAVLNPSSAGCGGMALDAGDLVGMIVVPSFSRLDSVSVQAVELAENCGFILEIFDLHSGVKEDISSWILTYHAPSKQEGSAAFTRETARPAENIMAYTDETDGLYILRSPNGESVMTFNPLVICLRVVADGTTDTENILKFDGSNPFRIEMYANYTVDGVYKPCGSCCGGPDEYVNPKRTPTNGVFLNEHEMFNEPVEGY